jgi:hypothetical protein
MRKLMKALKTEISGDLHDLAKMLQSKGRGKDTILAHITPKEAELLKKRGGSGTRNPDTGLLEYDPETAAIETGPVQEVVVSTDSESSAPSTTTPDVYIHPVSSYESTYTPSQYAPETMSAQLSPYAAGPSTVNLDSSPVRTPLSLNPFGDAGAGLNAAETPVDTKGDQGFFGKMTGQDLARLGLAGAGGIAGALQSRKASKQIEAAQREQQAMAQPYQKMGNELVGQASKGILSPASQQAYQAAQAQLTQIAQNRGGVGVEQAQNQLAMIRTNLLNNQMQYGLQIAQVGDRMALGALQTGLQLDQQLNQTSQAFYTQLASIAAGLPMYRA